MLGRLFNQEAKRKIELLKDNRGLTDTLPCDFHFEFGKEFSELFTECKTDKEKQNLLDYYYCARVLYQSDSGIDSENVCDPYVIKNYDSELDCGHYLFIFKECNNGSSWKIKITP